MEMTVHLSIFTETWSNSIGLQVVTAIFAALLVSRVDSSPDMRSTDIA